MARTTELPGTAGTSVILAAPVQARHKATETATAAASMRHRGGRLAPAVSSVRAW